MNILSLKDYNKTKICPFCRGHADCRKTMFNYDLAACDNQCLLPVSHSFWYFKNKLKFISFRKNNWEIEIRMESGMLELIKTGTEDLVANIPIDNLDSEYLKTNFDVFVDWLRVFS